MSDSNDNTSNIPDRVAQMQAVQKEAFETFLRKNKDYGDAFATYGPVGVIVRIGDKIARLTSVTSSGVNLVQDETIRDTLMDLHNYAAMAVMLLDEGKNVNDTINIETIELPCAPEMVEEDISDLQQQPGNIHQKEAICEENGGKICPFCTYVNNPTVTVCEMCYNELE
tara:strand:+ start:262 stop:768 length:507 start_codon:yes stop_codon:yes gene_type:complete